MQCRFRGARTDLSLGVRLCEHIPERLHGSCGPLSRKAKSRKEDKKSSACECVIRPVSAIPRGTAAVESVAAMAIVRSELQDVVADVVGRPRPSVEPRLARAAEWNQVGQGSQATPLSYRAVGPTTARLAPQQTGTYRSVLETWCLRKSKTLLSTTERISNQTIHQTLDTTCDGLTIKHILSRTLFAAHPNGFATH